MRHYAYISITFQVLIALRYYAKGGFASELAHIHGVSATTVRRCVKKVSAYLCTTAPDEIKLDPNDRYY